MNKIEQMIKDLCPEGVERVKLGNVMTIVRGASPRPIQNFMSSKENGVPWIKIGDVRPDDKYVNATQEFITKAGSEKSRLLKKGDFILSNSMSFGRPYILNISGCIHDGWIAMSGFENRLNSDYLYQILKSNAIQGYWRKNANNGGAMTNLNADIVRETEIPLPPLPIQQEIVRILDSFTSMITNLETELASRQRQYEYYRNKLLTFDEGDESVEWKTLGEIGTVVRGNGLQKSDFSEEGVGCVHYGQIYTRLGFSIDKTLTFVPEDLAEKLTRVEPGNLIIACTSENVEDVCKSVVWLGSETIVTGGHACVFKHNENPKYVGYCFLTNNFFEQKQKYAYGAKVIDIKTEKLELIKIPVPSKDRQQEIVSTLDTFESLISNIKQELEVRKKQYEYYREKLLTFE